MESESIEVSPFQEEIVLENYYAGAGRGAVLGQMKEAIQNGVHLMVLTGEEGSGKTMLCRVLENEVSPLCKSVFFSHTVDSFEEVIFTITKGLELDAVKEMAGGDLDSALDLIADALLSNSMDLLVIFDEAENIFLATLERIRKMLGRLESAGARVHVLFSGRNTFMDNCEQLSLCNFQNSDELHFELEPLSQAETADYLNACGVRLRGLDVTKVFTHEVVGGIYSLAQGNFRQTNMLGAESVNIHGDDNSFMVLLDSVDQADEVAGQNSASGLFPGFFREYINYLPWIGGTIGILLVLLFFLRSGDDGSGVVQDFDRPDKLKEPEIVMAFRLPEEQAPEKEVEQIAPEQDKSLQEIDQSPIENDMTAGGSADEKKISTVVETEKQLTENAQDIATPPQAVPEEEVAQPKSVQNLTEDLSREQGVEPDTSPELSRKIVKIQAKGKIRKVVAPTASSGNNQLYEERLAAGLGWTNSQMEGRYTVQLLALTSATAETNLKKMLAQVSYRQEAGNFYIFKKKTAPENIYVFYGEYPSIEVARLVKNSLPKFLRDHKPYALSIKGAIDKVGL